MELTHMHASLEFTKRQVSIPMEQSPTDVLDQTAGNSTEGNKRFARSKQNMTQDLINLEGQ